VRDHIRTLVGRYAGVGMDKLFGGDDAARRDVEGGHASNVRLTLADFRLVDKLEALNAVVFTALLEREELGLFVTIGGDHQLAAMTEWNLVFLAEFVGEAIAFHAQASLQRALRIVNPRMVDTAVARAGGHAELGKLLDEENVLPALGDGPSNGAADHAPSDD